MNPAQQMAEAVARQPAAESEALVRTWAERREVERRRETHELADRLGRALAVELNDQQVEGGGWRHQAAPVCFVSLTLEHPSGMSLSLVHEGSHLKGAAGRRLTVRGGYPSEYIGWRAGPVTIGIDTSPFYQARHIVRRLLPEYQQTFTVAQDVQQRVLRETDARRVLNRRMRTVLPALHAASWDQPHDADAREQSYWSTAQYRPDGSTAPRARCSGSVRLADHAQSAEVLKLTDVPKDLLLQILALVNGQPVLEGRVMPRELGRHRPELPPVPQVIRL